MKLKLTIVCICLFSTAAVFAAEPQWQNLFDGKTLKGWTQMGGKAKFEVADGVIVGTTAPDTPNSFLCTDKEYGNFVLELDFMADEELNSGVQFRSKFINGLVRGYQYEIDPDMTNAYAPTGNVPLNYDANGELVPMGGEPRRWTGGVYDEKQRGWIGALSHNPAARAAFKPGVWNKVRIEAKNDVIRTYINGVPAANLVDFVVPNGFIGLQVHAVPEFKKLEVRFRNIRILDLGLNPDEGDKSDPLVGEWKDAKTGHFAQVWYDLPNSVYKVTILNELSKTKTPVATIEAEDKADRLFFPDQNGYSGELADKVLAIDGPEHFVFRGKKFTRKSPTLGAIAPDDAIVLFDGTDMDAWGSLAPKEWTEPGGEGINSVKMVPGGRFEMVPGKGSIVTKQKFSDCKLHVEFRLLGEQTNGGVYMLSRYEFNIKDSYGYTGGDPVGAWGNVAAPVYENNHNYALPPMMWQTMDVEFTAPRFDAGGKKIASAKATMYLNGELMYRDAEVESLRGAAGRLGEAPTGPIYLQEHGTAYQFRNIWIVDRSK